MTYKVETYITYEDCECGGEFKEYDTTTMKMSNPPLVEYTCDTCGMKKWLRNSGIRTYKEVIE
jgi:uncharacterized protein YlaI